MKILVAGATGSIGLHVVSTAIEMGHQPIALVRNKRKVKLLPRGTDVFYGDVSMAETLTELPKDIDAILPSVPMVRVVLAPARSITAACGIFYAYSRIRLFVLA